VSGVRQGGILSPILFNVYVDDMIVNLRCNGDMCCHVGIVVSLVVRVMYADDLLLLSPSILGLHKMLDICCQYIITHNILFNPSKTVSVAMGHTRSRDFSPVCVWINTLYHGLITLNIWVLCIMHVVL
jgi:hypothetical protein